MEPVPPPLPSAAARPPLRLGLCCLFRSEGAPRFRTATAASLSKLPRDAALAKLGELGLGNAVALRSAVRAAGLLGFGAFRVLTPLLPLYTHPEMGYRIDDLPTAAAIRDALAGAGASARAFDIRLSFHPDQFVVPGSPDPRAARSSVEELLYQDMLCDLTGAEVVSIHAGGAHGDKRAALARLARRIESLPGSLRRRLAIENDDRVFTPADLAPACRSMGLPMVYDVHHHRCAPDGLGVHEATELCLRTWEDARRGEPYLHVSSPREGWGSPAPSRHADYIAPEDVPAEWLGGAVRATVDIEAKAKELAILRLMADLGLPRWDGAPAAAGASPADLFAARDARGSPKQRRSSNLPDRGGRPGVAGEVSFSTSWICADAGADGPPGALTEPPGANRKRQGGVHGWVLA